MEAFRTLALLAAVPLGASQSTPGFQFLGWGYDILRGNPRDTRGYGDPGYQTNIFVFTNERKQKTPDGKWDIPDKTTSQPISACSISQNQWMINSMYSYKHTVEFGLDIAGNFFGAEFDFSIDTKHIRETTDDQKSIFAHVESQCAAYALSMHIFDHPDVDPNFRAGVLWLPVTYDEEKYMKFLRTFGTHYVYQMTLGGRWGWQMEFHSEDFQTLMDDGIDTSLYIGYAGQVKAGLGFNTSTDTRLLSKVTSAVYRNSSFNTGGDFKTNVNDWQQTVREFPMPIHQSLMQLTDLFTDDFLPDVPDLDARKANLQTAMDQYCAYLNKHDSGGVNGSTCTPPKPVPMPTPPPDIKDSIHRVCVKNSGGYALYFDMFIPGSTHRATSDTYPNPESRCLDGQMINAQSQEYLRCQVHIIAGSSPQCEGSGYKYNPMSTLQANYECDGSTMSNHCAFRGLSQIGEWQQTLFVNEDLERHSVPDNTSETSTASNASYLADAFAATKHHITGLVERVESVFV